MSVVFEGSIASRILGDARFVRVHLPASYQEANVRRFPVLYMQDGQNSFTAVGDHVAYGWGNWALDRTADELARMGSMGEIIHRRG